MIAAAFDSLGLETTMTGVDGTPIRSPGAFSQRFALAGTTEDPMQGMTGTPWPASAPPGMPQSFAGPEHHDIAVQSTPGAPSPTPVLPFDAMMAEVAAMKLAFEETFAKQQELLAGLIQKMQQPHPQLQPSDAPIFDPWHRASGRLGVAPSFSVSENKRDVDSSQRNEEQQNKTNLLQVKN